MYEGMPEFYRYEKGLMLWKNNSKKLFVDKTGKVQMKNPKYLYKHVGAKIRILEYT